MEARGAYAARVKGIPRMAALAEPAIILPGRPATKRAADARAGRLVGLVFLKIEIRSNRGGVSFRTLTVYWIFSSSATRFTRDSVFDSMNSFTAHSDD